MTFARSQLLFSGACQLKCACIHSVPSDLCSATGSLSCLLVVHVHMYILDLNSVTLKCACVHFVTSDCAV